MARHGAEVRRSQWGGEVCRRSIGARGVGQATPLTDWLKHVEPIGDGGRSVPPERQWLVVDKDGNGVIPYGKPGQVVAAGGAGKTTALIQLAVSLATGYPWFDTYPIVRPGKVMVLLGEEDRDEVRRKVYNALGLIGDRNLAIDDIIYFMPLSGVPAPMVVRNGKEVVNSEFLSWILTYLTTTHIGEWVAVIIDPASRFGGEELEVSNSWATRFVQALEAISRATGATVACAHHSAKAARQRGAEVDGRGSSGFEDGSRWTITMSVDEAGLVTIDDKKQSYGKSRKPLVLRRSDEHDGALVPLTEDELEDAAKERYKRSPVVLKEMSKAAYEEDKNIRLTTVALDIVSIKDLSSKDFRAAISTAGHCNNTKSDGIISMLKTSKKIFTYKCGRYIMYTTDSSKEEKPNNVVHMAPNPDSPVL